MFDTAHKPDRTVRPVELCEQRRVLSVRDPSLVIFILISYVWSWGFWFLSSQSTSSVLFRTNTSSFSLPLKAVMLVLGDVGPAIAAIATVALDSKPRGIRSLAARLIPRNAALIVAAFLLPVAIFACPLVYAGRSMSALFSLSNSERWLRVFLINLPFAPFCEEIGWRGYLLPYLQAKYKPLTASMAVGAIWGIWHTPLYLTIKIPGSFSGAFPLCFFAMILGVNILFSWIYNVGKGNLGVVILLHASFNSTVIAFLGPALANGMEPFIAVTIAVWLVALAIVGFTRARLSYSCMGPHV